MTGFDASQRLLLQGQRCQQQGQLEAAGKLYRQALATAPDSAPAWYFLGWLMYQQGRLAEAAEYLTQAAALDGQQALYHECLGQVRLALGQKEQALVSYQMALKLEPDNQQKQEWVADLQRQLQRQLPAVEELVAQGVKKYRQGEFAAAERHFQAAIQHNSGYGEAYRYLGLILKQRGETQAALHALQQAAAAYPPNPQAFNSLGTFLGELQQFSAAAAAFEQAVELAPDFAQAHYNLGLAWQKLGKAGQALASLQRAVELQPDSPVYRYNLGAIYIELGKQTILSDEMLNEAAEQFRTAIRLEPAYAEAHYGLALVSQQLEAFDEAIAAYQRAVTLNQGYAEASFRLGALMGVLYQFGGSDDMLDQAIFYLRRAIETSPNHAEAHYNLGLALRQHQKLTEAIQCHEMAISLAPERKAWQLEKDMALPTLFQSEAELRQWRQQIETRLAGYPSASFSLSDMLRQPQSGGHNFSPPFQLVYQGYNDRTFKQRYAQLFAVEEQDQIVPDRKRRPGDGRYHLGFLVTRYHEAGFICFVLNVIRNLDRNKFKVSVVCHSAGADSIRSQLGQYEIDFVYLARTLPHTLANLKAAAFDLLYYWEVGTDSINYLLPLFRPATIQCTGWGTPSTTGLPEMDYFLSSDSFEPARADEHYTEQLVRLQTLGMYYQRPAVAPLTKTRADLGLSDTEHLYFCTQNLPKFHPEFDWLLAEILRRDNRSRILVRAKRSPLNNLLRVRWQTRIPDVADRIEFVPHQSYDDHLNLMKVVDVLLDTIHYSGGTTSYEAVAVGTPIVTWPGEFMRGRMTYGCYRQIGVLDTVVESAEAYVAKAVQIATDRAYQQHLRHKILAAGAALFDDLAAVHELETFFSQALERAN